MVQLMMNGFKCPVDFLLKMLAKDLKSKYKAAMEEPDPGDPVQKKIAQLYRETLKMQKIQNVRLLSSLKTLKNFMESFASKKETAMDTRIPPMSHRISFYRETHKRILNLKFNQRPHNQDVIC